MDDARRFLRYVMPGLVYGVVTVFLLLIVFPHWTLCQIRYFAEQNSLGLALGSVLTSGALGYIFSSLHHLCHWLLASDRDVMNHARLVKRLLDEELIPEHFDIYPFARKGGEPLNTSDLKTRQTALMISMALWYGPVKEGAHIGDWAYKKLDSLGDQAHGLGSSRVASFFAPLTALMVCWEFGTFSCQPESVIRFAVMFAAGIFITCMFHRGYVRVGRTAQGIYDRVLYAALRKPASTEPKAVPNNNCSLKS